MSIIYLSKCLVEIHALQGHTYLALLQNAETHGPESYSKEEDLTLVRGINGKKRKATL
jgi:hypothetical protein